jgi:tetratricopeptide (TPR) repeat protein
VPADQVPVDPEPAAARYRSLLADRRVLVVLDNAGSLDQVRPLLPGGAGCLVLVTSRERLIGLVAREGAVHIDLEVLSPGEAGELLARMLGEERVGAEPESTVELSRWCGFLPLALRIGAASLVLDRRLSVAAQAARLASGDRLATLAVDQDEHTAVRVAFDHSYASLPPGARRLFRLLGLVPGPHVTVAAAAALAGTTPAEASRLLDRLAGAHLADRSAPGGYTLHDLVRLYAADRAGADESAAARQAATEWLFGWYLHTSDAAGQLLYPEALRLPLPGLAGPVSPTHFDEQQQALAWLEAERPNLVAAIQHAAEHGPHPPAYRLAGRRRRERRPVRDAEAAAERSLGNVHNRQNRPEEAASHFRRALAISERTGWTQAQSAALNNLGNAYRRLERLPEAVDCFQRALALNRQSGWLAGAAHNLGNLGFVNLHLGRLEQALDYTNESLALFRRLGARARVAHALGNLGEVHQQLGRLDEAQDDLTRALALGDEVGDLTNVAEFQRVLAAVHRDAGRYPQALAVAEGALALARDLKDSRAAGDVLATLSTIHHCLGQYGPALAGMAAAQHRLGRVAEAGRTAREAMERARAGGYRVAEGNTLTTLAAIDLAAGRVAEAAAHAERAIAIQQGTGHRLGEATARREFGNARHRGGDPDAAAASWQHANRIFTEIGSPEAAQLPRPAGCGNR